MKNKPVLYIIIPCYNEEKRKGKNFMEEKREKQSYAPSAGGD